MIIGCHNHPIRESQNSFYLLVVNIAFVRRDSSVWIDVCEMSLDHIDFRELLLSILVVCSHNTVQVRQLQQIRIDEIDLMKSHMDEMLCYYRAQTPDANDGDDLLMHNCSHHIQSKYHGTPIKKTLYSCNSGFRRLLICVLVEVSTVDVLHTPFPFYPSPTSTPGPPP